MHTPSLQKLILSAAGILIFVTLIVILRRPSEDLPSTQATGKTISSSTSSRALVKAPAAPKDPRMKELLSGDENPIRFSIKDAENYLEKVGRNAKSLTAAYWLTRDQRYLTELKDCAGDSIVAISTLAAELEGWEPRLKFADKMVMLDPSNKAGYLLQMEIHIGMKDYSKAMEALQLANQATNFNQYDVEKIMDQREAWQTIGIDPVTARIRTDQNNAASNAMISNIFYAMRDLWREQTASMNDNEKLESATEFLKGTSSLAASTRLNTSRATVVASSAERVILSQLPGDAEYGETGLTVAERIEQNQTAVKEMLDSYLELERRLAEASPEIVNHYFQRIDTLGTKAAQEWMLSRPE